MEKSDAILLTAESLQPMAEYLQKAKQSSSEEFKWIEQLYQKCNAAAIYSPTSIISIKGTIFLELLSLPDSMRSKDSDLYKILLLMKIPKDHLVDYFPRENEKRITQESKLDLNHSSFFKACHSPTPERTIKDLLAERIIKDLLAYLKDELPPSVMNDLEEMKKSEVFIFSDISEWLANHQICDRLTQLEYSAKQKGGEAAVNTISKIEKAKLLIEECKKEIENEKNVFQSLANGTLDKEPCSVGSTKPNNQI